MTTSTISRTLFAITLGVSLAAFAGRADPSSTGSLSLGPTNLSPSGLPDRDVVRNPYSALLGTGGSSSGLLPQSVGVVGPNLGLGVGFTPGLIFGGGGGGGGGFPSSVGFTGLALGGGPPSTAGNFIPAGTNPGTSGGSSSVFVNSGGFGSPGVPPFVLPPGGSSSSNQTSNTSTNFAVVQAVPDGGHALALLGGGLLIAFIVQRRIGQGKR